MKTLFDENGQYTEDGQRFRDEFADAVSDLIKSYVHGGFPKHEVSYLAQTSSHVVAINAAWSKPEATD